VHYSRQLTGASRERIVDYWESSGLLDQQVRQLQSYFSWKRAEAAFVLGDVGPLRVAPLLVGLLDDPEHDVRAAAARSLGRLGAVEAIGPLITASVRGRLPREVADMALLDIGPPAVESLAELAGHEDPGVRASAVHLIGLTGAAADIGPVVDHLADPAASVRAASASSLGRLGAGEARDALIVALGDRVPDVRTAAARALGQIGGQQATEALIPIARTDLFEPARAAAQAIGRMDPAVLLRLAADHDTGPHLLEAADRAAL
jgi:HEAT repeat protein